MTTEIMTIHEALCELKVLDKRIKQEIAGTVFATTVLHCNDKINGVPIKEFSETVRSKYDRITDLIKRRTAIKKAITNSNATTMVTIGNDTMTVAEAIEYKRSGIEFKQALLEKISRDYSSSVVTVNVKNDALTDRATDYIERAYTNKDSVNKDTIESARQDFIDRNTLDLVDPINGDKVIAELSKEIDTFVSKVDSTLSISNALTKVEISY